MLTRNPLRAGITRSSSSTGFSLVELLGVMVIIGILAAATTSSFLPSNTFQLQSSRDQLVAAFFSAQQHAMAQTDTVSLVLSAPNQVDVRENGSSIRVGGVQYPISLLPNQTITPTSFSFDRLGRTSAANVTLSQNGTSVTIQVQSTGYIN